MTVASVSICTPIDSVCRTSVSQSVSQYLSVFEKSIQIHFNSVQFYSQKSFSFQKINFISGQFISIQSRSLEFSPQCTLYTSHPSPLLAAHALAPWHRVGGPPARTPAPSAGGACPPPQPLRAPAGPWSAALAYAPWACSIRFNLIKDSTFGP